MNRTIIENAINILVSEFIEAPYQFFTEADAIVRFHQILEQEMGDECFTHSKDGFKISLIHREYPTFFQFSGSNPAQGLSSLGSRGHYDMVILTPEFVTSHPAELVHNRNVKRRPDPNIVPFQAVIEFKFDYIGWSKGRAKGAINTLWKLRLGNESPLRYFVVLMRYSSPSITRWKNYWPMVKAEAERFNEIGSIFAINWLTIKTGHDEYRFGNWEHEDHI